MRHLVSRIGVVVGLVLVALAAPSAASAVDRWPGSTIRYHSTLPPSFDWSLNAATLAWNRAGIRMRFVRVTNPRKAQVTIRMGRSFSAAHASVGRQRGAYIVVNGPKNRRLPIENRVRMAALLTHELGHVLGLNHPRSVACTIMHPSPTECDRGAPMGYYSCRLVRPADLAAARRLYGRRTPTAPRYCLIDPFPPPVGPVTVTGGGLTGVPAQLSWPPVRGRLPVRTTVAVTYGYADNCAKTGPVRITGGAVLAPTATRWTYPGDLSFPQTLCFQVRVENASGAAARTWRQSIAVGPAPPATPVIGPVIAEGDVHRVTVSIANSAYLQVQRGPAAQCPTTPDMGEGVWADPDGGSYLLSGIPPGTWCLAFFATAYDQTSPPATTLVTVAEPPPLSEEMSD